MSNDITKNVLVLSSFNSDNFSSILSSSEDFPKLSAITVEFNGLNKALIDETHDCWKKNINYLFIWADPSKVFHYFSELELNNTQANLNLFHQEYGDFIRLLLNVSKKVETVFVVNWDLIGVDSINNIWSWKPMSKRYLLAQMNLKLVNETHLSNIEVLDSSGWFSEHKDFGFVPKLWFMSKTPFLNSIFFKACASLKNSIRSLSGDIRKLLILDLDNTLWGGVLGDDGINALNIGGHSPIGEAFLDFQKRIKMAKEKGLMLAIASKNDEKSALDAINNHPEMVLREEDFVAWKINWNDKASNILEIANELKISLSHVVFIDDNSAEQDRVRTALKEVYVPFWGNTPYLFSSDFEKIASFAIKNPSIEDRNRTKIYKDEKKRSQYKYSIPTRDEWIKGLDIKVTISPFHEKNLKRVVQLFNKTNMMNLSSNRITEDECRYLVKNNNLNLLTFRMKDKFGDSGVVGIISYYLEENDSIIRDFIISCRAIGRGLEEVMTHIAVLESKKLGAQSIIAKYKPTERNIACLEYWKSSQFRYIKGKNTFIHDLNLKYTVPNIINFIQIEKDLS